MRDIALLFTGIFLLVACSGKPSESQIEKIFIAAISNNDQFRLQGMMIGRGSTIKNFVKTNGFDKDGKTYIADIEYDVTDEHGNPSGHHIKSQITMINTENGWKLEKEQFVSTKPQEINNSSTSESKQAAEIGKYVFIQQYSNDCFDIRNIVITGIKSTKSEAFKGWPAWNLTMEYDIIFKMDKDSILRGFQSLPRHESRHSQPRSLTAEQRNFNIAKKLLGSQHCQESAFNSYKNIGDTVHLRKDVQLIRFDQSNGTTYRMIEIEGDYPVNWESPRNESREYRYPTQ